MCSQILARSSAAGGSAHDQGPRRSQLNVGRDVEARGCAAGLGRSQYKSKSPSLTPKRVLHCSLREPERASLQVAFLRDGHGWLRVGRAPCELKDALTLGSRCVAGAHQFIDQAQALVVLSEQVESLETAVFGVYERRLDHERAARHPTSGCLRAGRYHQASALRVTGRAVAIGWIGPARVECATWVARGDHIASQWPATEAGGCACARPFVCATRARRDGSRTASRLAKKAQNDGWKSTWLHRWLVANAARFGFKPLSTEAWHWDYDSALKARSAGAPPVAGSPE